MEPLAQVELTRYVKALKILSLGLGHLDKIKKETETTTEKTEKIWEYYSKVFRAIKEDIDVKIPRLYSIQNLDEKLEKIKTEAEYLFHNNKKEYRYFQYFRKFFIHLEGSKTFFDIFAKNQDNSFVYIRSEKLNRIDGFNCIATEEVREIIEEEIKECDKRGRWGNGIVYLLGNEQARFLKIGHTIDLEQRLRQLQSNSAYLLTIIKTKRGSYDTEKTELLKAKNFRIQGELFTWDDSIIDNFQVI